MVNQHVHYPNLETHQECLLFCFLPIIQRELSEFATSWNLRHVRKSTSVPGGKPDLLFAMPETIGYQQCGIPVSETDLEIARNTLGIQNHPIYKDKDLFELLFATSIFTIFKLQLTLLAQ